MTNAKQVADEREAFEKWYCQDDSRQGVPLPRGIAHLRDGDGYGDDRTMLNGKWQGWKAHAALSPAPAAPHLKTVRDVLTRMNRKVGTRRTWTR